MCLSKCLVAVVGAVCVVGGDVQNLKSNIWEAVGILCQKVPEGNCHSNCKDIALKCLVEDQVESCVTNQLPIECVTKSSEPINERASPVVTQGVKTIVGRDEGKPGERVSPVVTVVLDPKSAESKVDEWSNDRVPAVMPGDPKPAEDSRVMKVDGKISGSGGGSNLVYRQSNERPTGPRSRISILGKCFGHLTITDWHPVRCHLVCGKFYHFCNKYFDSELDINNCLFKLFDAADLALCIDGGIPDGLPPLEIPEH